MTRSAKIGLTCPSRYRNETPGAGLRVLSLNKLAFAAPVREVALGTERKSVKAGG